MTDSNVPMIFGLMIVFEVLATACMCLRFCSKRVTHARWFPDDYFLILSWVVGTIAIGIALWMTRYGLGHRREWITTLHMGEQLKHYGPATTFASFTARWISMLSFFVTLLRLVSKAWKKAILWFFMTSCVVSYFAATILQSFYVCGVWDLVSKDRCVPEHYVNAYALYVSIYGSIVDFTFTLVPTIVIWRLQMRPLEKVAIACAMSTGILAGIVSIVKIVKNHELLYEDNRDPFTAGVVSTLASVEVSCTITATSIPFFRPLIRRITGKDSSYHSGGGVVSKQQEAGNGVSVLEVGTGQQGPNYFGR